MDTTWVAVLPEMGDTYVAEVIDSDARQLFIRTVDGSVGSVGVDTELRICCSRECAEKAVRDMERGDARMVKSAYAVAAAATDAGLALLTSDVERGSAMLLTAGNLCSLLEAMTSGAAGWARPRVDVAVESLKAIHDSRESYERWLESYGDE